MMKLLRRLLFFPFFSKGWGCFACRYYWLQLRFFSLWLSVFISYSIVVLIPLDFLSLR